MGVNRIGKELASAVINVTADRFEIAKSQDAANAEHFLDILTRSLSESEIAAIRSEAQEFHLMAAIGELSNIAPAAGPGGSPQGCP